MENDHVKECPFRETIAVFDERLERIDAELFGIKKDIKNILDRLEKVNIAIAEERAKIQAKGDTLARIIALTSLIVTAGNAVISIIQKAM